MCRHQLLLLSSLWNELNNLLTFICFNKPCSPLYLNLILGFSFVTWSVPALVPFRMLVQLHCSSSKLLLDLHGDLHSHYGSSLRNPHRPVGCSLHVVALYVATASSGVPSLHYCTLQRGLFTSHTTKLITLTDCTDLRLLCIFIISSCKCCTLCSHVLQPQGQACLTEHRSCVYLYSRTKGTSLVENQ